jgi:hypothetical protein
LFYWFIISNNKQIRFTPRRLHEDAPVDPEALKTRLVPGEMIMGIMEAYYLPATTSNNRLREQMRSLRLQRLMYALLF